MLPHPLPCPAKACGTTITGLGRGLAREQGGLAASSKPTQFKRDAARPSRQNATPNDRGRPGPASPLPPPRTKAASDLMMDPLPLINVYVQRIYTSAHRQLMRDISMHKSSVNTVINFVADSFLII